MSVLPALVETVAPLIVILSITKEVKPATSVVVAPKVNVVEPNVKVGFAKLAFVIPALPDKFEFVISAAVTVTSLSVTAVSIPEPPVNVSVSAVL